VPRTGNSNDEALDILRRSLLTIARLRGGDLACDPLAQADSFGSGTHRGLAVQIGVGAHQDPDAETAGFKALTTVIAQYWRERRKR